MINKCIVCGTIFESPRKRPYCGEPCRHKDNYKSKRKERECRYCGKVYLASKRAQGFCSRSCRGKHIRRENAETVYCRNCGKCMGNAVGLNGRTFCSDECSLEWWKENPRHRRVCPICGETFRTNDVKQKYCSYKCAFDSMRRKDVCTCKNCGKEYVPKVNDRVTFCSRECYYKYCAANKKPPVTKKPYSCVCAHCGERFTAKAKRKYCSEKCKKKQWAIQGEQRRKKKQREFVPEITICPECGATFKSEYGRPRRKYCSNACANKRGYRVKAIRKRERLIDNGLIDYSITLTKLCKRDKGICYLCGERVNMKLDPNSDWYGSIDHVIPVVNGGTHTWDNIKLAHRWCNSVKRTSKAEEIKELLG